MPIVSLHKLSRLYNTAVQVHVSQDLHILEFSRQDVAKMFFEPLKQSLLAKIEAQRGLDMLFGAGVQSSDGPGSSHASPYLMAALAMICQVKVSKLAERVVQKGEIPKGLHLIVDGEAQLVYDDAV